MIHTSLAGTPTVRYHAPEETALNSIKVHSNNLHNSGDPHRAVSWGIQTTEVETRFDTDESLKFLCRQHLKAPGLPSSLPAAPSQAGIKGKHLIA